MAAKKRAKRKSVNKKKYVAVKITTDQASHVIDDLDAIINDAQNSVKRIKDIRGLLCKVDFCSS